MTRAKSDLERQNSDLERLKNRRHRATHLAVQGLTVKTVTSPVETMGRDGP